MLVFYNNGFPVHNITIPYKLETLHGVTSILLYLYIKRGEIVCKFSQRGNAYVDLRARGKKQGRDKWVRPAYTEDTDTCP